MVTGVKLAAPLQLVTAPVESVKARGSVTVIITAVLGLSHKPSALTSATYKVVVAATVNGDTKVLPV